MAIKIETEETGSNVGVVSAGNSTPQNNTSKIATFVIVAVVLVGAFLLFK